MKKVSELYELMIDYRQILEISESKKDLKLLSEFIELLENYKDIAYSEFIKNLGNISKSKSSATHTRNKIKSTKYDISKVVLAYKNFIGRTNAQLQKSDAELLEAFNSKYPIIKDILSLKNSELYNKIHSIPIKKFTLIELQFLLMFYFDAKVSSKNTKGELYDRLLNNIYQNNYLDSLSTNYSNASNNLE